MSTHTYRMLHHFDVRRTISHREQRSARVLLWLLLSLGVTMVGVGVLVYWMMFGGKAPPDSSALVHSVIRADFEYYITERGDVESGGNVEIRCRVQSRGAPGVAKLEIHPEGEFVKKGDLLVRFDDSLYRQELNAQDILVAQSQALVLQSESDLRAAQIALEEYQQGTFAQERTVIESEVFVAQENLRRGEEYLKYSRRLAARGYVTDIQLEADRFAVEKARKELQAAQQKLSLHEEYTRKKMVVQLEAQVAKMEAALAAARNTLKFNSEKRDEIKEQVDNCTIYAPQDGQVVYASETDGRGEEAIIIEEGSVVRQGQVVVLLPNSQQMQVGVRVSETKVGLIREGNSATVYLDSVSAGAISGVISEVGGFPLPKRRSYEPNEYRTVVTLSEEVPNLRPGLRAKVKMFVESEANVLQIPLASVFLHGGEHFCVKKVGPQKWLAQPVAVGPNNDKFVVIRDGLSEGDAVAINPDSYRDVIELPELTDEEQESEGSKKVEQVARS